MLTQNADPCTSAGPEKCTPLHLAVMPLSQVAFIDSDQDSLIFSRSLEGVINAKLSKRGEAEDDIDDANVTSISYNEADGKLTWITLPEEGSSWSILPAIHRGWVPARISTLVQGTAVETDGLPKPVSRMPLVTALLEARADANAQNEDPENDLENFTSTTYKDLEQRQHRSALHYAAESGEAGLCAKLIKANALVSLEDRFKMTPLDLALEENHEVVADVLLRSSADPNRGNMRRGLKQACLHQMSDVGNPKLVKLLLKHGGKVNAPGKQGMTPLHLAARRNHVEVVKLLLESGADPSLLDASGRSACQYAISNKHSELAQALAVDSQLLQLSDRLAFLEDAKARQVQKQRERELLEELHAS